MPVVLDTVICLQDATANEMTSKQLVHKQQKQFVPAQTFGKNKTGEGIRSGDRHCSRVKTSTNAS